MVAKDDKMRKTSECLRNMRILKLQAWEDRYRVKLEEMRWQVPLNLTIAKADGSVDSITSATVKQSISNTHNNNSPPPSFVTDEIVFVGEENVPLEGVIQFEKPNSSSRLDK